MKPLLQFSHANGFPASCYRIFLGQLRERFTIRAIECVGHNPRFPVTDNWTRLADELVDAASGATAPVIAMGHSLGGYVSFLAAIKRPDLFRAVILLDAPILSRFQGSALLIVKKLRLIDRLTPAAITRTRRKHWPSADAAVAHFKGKSVFKHFDPRCLEDYARFGTVPAHDGVELRFNPDIEYEIYRTLPHNLAGLAKKLTRPAGLLMGDKSHLLKHATTANPRHPIPVMLTSGTHLFPFEQPEVAADAVVRMARALEVL